MVIASQRIRADCKIDTVTSITFAIWISSWLSSLRSLSTYNGTTVAFQVSGSPCYLTGSCISKLRLIPCCQPADICSCPLVPVMHCSRMTGSDSEMLCMLQTYVRKATNVGGSKDFRCEPSVYIHIVAIKQTDKGTRQLSTSFHWDLMQVTGMVLYAWPNYSINIRNTDIASHENYFLPFFGN